MAEDSVIRFRSWEKLFLFGVFSVVIWCSSSCSKKNYLYLEPEDEIFIDTISVVIEQRQEQEIRSSIIISNFAPLGFKHQSAAVYGDHAFFVANGRASICMYDLKKGEITYTLKASSENATVYHCNQSTFGIEKYVSSDPFPLLYISQRSKSQGRCFIEVFRILPEPIESEMAFNSFKVELVQTIFMPPMTKENSMGNVNCVIDAQTGRLYTYSRNNNSKDSNYLKCKVSQFSIPGIYEKEVVLEDSDIISSFLTDISAYNMQGGCINDGFLYVGQGYPSAGYIYLNVFDLKQNKLLMQIDLRENGVEWEPEGCFYYDGGLMLAHTDAICRVEFK